MYLHWTTTHLSLFQVVWTKQRTATADSISEKSSHLQDLSLSVF
jgi:hypothetical protein